MSVLFDGTFVGKAGHLRGSPFTVTVDDEGDGAANDLQGPLVMNYIRAMTKDVKDYSTALKSNKYPDELNLVKVKERQC